jgi:hypothetical protein
MAKPKLIFAKSPKRPHKAGGTRAAGYRIYATYRWTSAGEYIGGLKAVRISDDRLLSPSTEHRRSVHLETRP